MMLKLSFFINLWKQLAMKQKLPAILILFVFLSLQFGKISSYLYCKWQAEFLQNKTDCGCDDHLVAMFDHNGQTDDGMLAHNNLNEKIAEYAPHSLAIDLSQSIPAGKNYFAEYDTPLCSSFIASPFHPPAV